MRRRDFMKISGLSALGMAVMGTAGLGGCTPSGKGPMGVPRGERMKGHFTLRQLTSVTDTIGNSYILQTAGGKVIVIDGGFETEAENLRGWIAKYGGVVDLWFITHPHQDHMGAFSEILKDKQGITVRKVIYSRCTDEVLKAETWAPENETDARRYYSVLDHVTEGTDILDLHTTGGRFDIDGIGIKVLGVANPTFLKESYNNNSMIIKFWDDTKSLLILGDAYVDCGNQALEKYPEWLDSDYIQMAHHGQNGCSKEFYDQVNFRVCLWPTPSWVWEPTIEWINTRDVRAWVEAKGITENHVSCLEPDWFLA
ncbi:MAG: MBL fold metallo-hydrolase [Bacteroidales bacterium]|nr:MBL fold metallo-hydrolase [Bacteroidales bacterium]